MTMVLKRCKDGGATPGKLMVHQVSARLEAGLPYTGSKARVWRTDCGLRVHPGQRRYHDIEGHGVARALGQCPDCTAVQVNA